MRSQVATLDYLREQTEAGAPAAHFGEWCRASSSCPWWEQVMAWRTRQTPWTTHPSQLQLRTCHSHPLWIPLSRSQLRLQLGLSPPLQTSNCTARKRVRECRSHATWMRKCSVGKRRPHEEHRVRNTWLSLLLAPIEIEDAKRKIGDRTSMRRHARTAPETKLQN